MSIHLLISDIAGESSDANHRDWIDLLEIKFATDRRIASASSTWGDRESSNAEFSELAARKFVDSSTPALFLEACCGRGRQIVIDVTKTGTGRGADTFTRYTLKNAIISGYHVEHVDLSKSSCADIIRPVETLTISFSALEIQYTPFDQDGAALSPFAVGFDTSTNSRI